MVEHPRRAVAALATGLAAIGVAIGSGADFTAQSANASTAFIGGTLSIDNTHEGGSFFDPGYMTPGGPPEIGVVDIQNTGRLAGRFTVTRDAYENHDTDEPAPTPMGEELQLEVVDCGTFDGENPPQCGDSGDATVYARGTLAAMSGPIGLGRFEPGERHRYRFAAELPASVGNEYQGDSTSAGFVWDAVQTDR
jgi:hypothetical protein